ncbi:LOW QUALITY PROTEIN: hypothetical protein U9M48_016123, partial [Paspalum notatum var. saurae]
EEESERRHLYIVCDESHGYSIRKVDLSSESTSDDSEEPPHQLHSAISELRLPPAVLRLQAPRGLSHYYFAAAFGTRILAMHPSGPGTDGKPCLLPQLQVPVFDVRTRGVIFAPRQKGDLAHPIYIPVRDRLFALTAGSFEQLWPPPLEYPGGDCWEWTWRELPKPPFETKQISSYAVHPDGRTIIVSTESGATAATFTFDTEAHHTLYGNSLWAMPCAGHSHFDHELDAFVGLTKDASTLGHLCSCDMAISDAGDGNCFAPAWKLSKEKLFNKDPSEKHVGATLVYLGGKSRFCLVHCISVEDDSVDEELDAPRPRRHLFRFTTFSLKYDKNGDLTIGKSCRVEHYKVPKVSNEFLLKNPQHLYLVLDDWQWGYSIRRVDLPSSDDDTDSDDQLLTAVSGDEGGAEQFRRRRRSAAELRLPPAVFRLEAPPDHPDYFAAAFGTKIIAMSAPDVTRRQGALTHPLPPICGAVPFLDVRTRLFGFAPRPEPEVNLERPICFAFDDDERLFVVSASSFKMLQKLPCCCWEWCELPKHPFDRTDATSYGAHPDGTIFVGTSTETFTLDTSKLPHGGEWKRHSQGTTLPFTGRAYFDSELDTWVGLYRGGDDDLEATGHLCTCDATSDERQGSTTARKLGKETLFSEDPAEEHFGATLVYMGGRSKFCLIERILIDDDDDDDDDIDCVDDERNFYKLPKRRVQDDESGSCRTPLRLTAFSLKFDKDGQPTTGNSRRVRYYKAPADAVWDDPVAFWIRQLRLFWEGTKVEGSEFNATEDTWDVEKLENSVPGGRSGLAQYFVEAAVGKSKQTWKNFWITQGMNAVAIQFLEEFRDNWELGLPGRQCSLKHIDK